MNPLKDSEWITKVNRYCTSEMKFFFATCILSLVTLLGANDNFRLNKDRTSKIALAFPGDQSEWNKQGDLKNTIVDDKGIIILSNAPRKARIFQDIEIGNPNNSRLNPEVLQVSGQIQPLIRNVDTTLNSIPSRFHAQLRNSQDGTRFHLFARTLLPPFENSAKTDSEEIKIKGISPHVNGSDTLRVSMVLRSAGAWRLEQLEISKSRLAVHYYIFVITIGGLWLLLLASFVTRYSKGKWVRGTGIVLMCMVLVVITTNHIGIFAKSVKPALLVLNPEWSGPVGNSCLLYTSPSPRDGLLSRMPSSA